MTNCTFMGHSIGQLLLRLAQCHGWCVIGGEFYWEETLKNATALSGLKSVCCQIHRYEGSLEVQSDNCQEVDEDVSCGDHPGTEFDVKE